MLTWQENMTGASSRRFDRDQQALRDRQTRCEQCDELSEGVRRCPECGERVCEECCNVRTCNKCIAAATRLHLVVAIAYAQPMERSGLHLVVDTTSKNHV